MSKERNGGEHDVLVRPLSARSLVASLLLRSPPGGMRASRLVQWCDLFGVSEGTARVALSRMVERGELRASNGTYELAGRMSGRRPAQDWSLAPRLLSWNGQWRLAAVHERGRAAADRSALRDAMRRLRVGEVREGLWARPHNLPQQSAPPDAWAVARAQCAWWTGRPDDEPRRLAAALFDPAEWAARADAVRARLEHATAGLDDASGDRRLAHAFEVGAAALAHIRADPLLPAELGPSAPAGESLRAAYRSYEAVFARELRAWFRART